MLDVEWPAVTIYSDQSLRPTAHPEMGGLNGDPNQFAGGVGVGNVATKFQLVRYILEAAHEGDPNFAFPSSSTETIATSVSGLTVPSGSCLRLRTLFGKKPQTGTTSTANCRLGRCGDLGYQVLSETVCPGTDAGVGAPPEEGGPSSPPGDGGETSTPSPEGGQDGQGPIIGQDVYDAVAAHGFATVDITIRGVEAMPEVAAETDELAYLQRTASAEEAVREKLPAHGVHVVYWLRHSPGFLAEVGRGRAPGACEHPRP